MGWTSARITKVMFSNLFETAARNVRFRPEANIIEFRKPDCSNFLKRGRMFAWNVLFAALQLSDGGHGNGVQRSMFANQVDEHRQSLPELTQLAERGNAAAQFDLGVMYAQGDGVAQDFGSAIDWYRRSASQGYAMAQTNLGMMYAKGLGVPSDYTQAADWYRRAAIQGQALAQVDLGGMYERGLGVPHDPAQAVEWFRKAAVAGNPQGESDLGVMYDRGEGVAQDYVQAMSWYRAAAIQGYAEAQYNLASMYEQGHGVPRNADEAKTWYAESAVQGDAAAKSKLDDLESGTVALPNDSPQNLGYKFGYLAATVGLPLVLIGVFTAAIWSVFKWLSSLTHIEGEVTPTSASAIRSGPCTQSDGMAVRSESHGGGSIDFGNGVPE
jgi:TPR repeat protein